MKIDISEILSARSSRLDFDFTVSFTEDMRELGMISDFIVFEENGITIRGKVQNVGGYLSLESTVGVKYTTQCDRCLDDVKCEMDFEFNRSISTADSGKSETFDSSDADEFWDDEDSDVIYVRDNKLSKNSLRN